MPVPYPGPLQGGGWEMVSCLLSAVIEKTDLLTFSTRCTEFCDSPFQKMGKHTACPDVWNIPVKKTTAFLEQHLQISLSAKTELPNEYSALWICVLQNRSVHPGIADCSCSSGKLQQLHPQNVLKHPLLTLPLFPFPSWPCLCFLSLFAAPNSSERPLLYSSVG